MQIYSDASALLRVLFVEPGESMPLLTGTIVAASKIIEVETFRALDRARLTGRMTDELTAQKNKELTELLSRLHLVPVSEDVIISARSTFPVSVRALDAIHVATAQMLQANVGPIPFWTHDKRQAIAATARSLDVRGIV